MQSNASIHPAPQARSPNALTATLRPGAVYRREDLKGASNAVDRHLRQLLDTGGLKKLAQGLYYAPKLSAFGELPPDDVALAKGFVRDDAVLVFSRSAYNSLGLGTTQLYNTTLVYNHKRHGVFQLGQRFFDFRIKPRFPLRLSPEFLLVDLLNHADELAEDLDDLWARVTLALPRFDGAALARNARQYGQVATRRRLLALLSDPSAQPSHVLASAP
jgi:Family of unknown function (DUF6088)